MSDPERYFRITPKGVIVAACMELGQIGCDALDGGLTDEMQANILTLIADIAECLQQDTAGHAHHD